MTLQSSGNILIDVARLRTSGTKIIDGLGNEVFLTGAQVDWNTRMKRQGSTTVATNPYESWFTESDIQTMKAGGANYFEIVTMRLTEIMPTKNIFNTGYFETWVDVWVEWATRNQMYITLDIAGFSYSGNYAIPSWIWQDYSEPSTKEEWDAIIRDFFDTDVTAQDSNRQAFVNAWVEIANRYKNNSYVLFSIINEPLCTVELIDSTTSAHIGQTYSLFMEDIVDAIHATGATNIIIINKPYVTGYSTYYGNVQPVNRGGIVWEDHYYMTPNHDFDFWASWIDTFVARLVGTFGKPLIIGEYGFDPQEYGKTAYPTTWKQHLANMVSYLNGKELCGRQWHQWGAIEGEHYDYVYDWYTASESQYILNTVLGY